MGFYVEVSSAAVEQIRIQDGALVPVTDNDIDLGTSSLEFKDAFFDGTVTSDAFAGPLTGNVTGNVSGTAASVTAASQSNITSLGTLTTLTVDNVIINGTTIGHTSDTDLITLASGIATVAGEISVTTLDIGGTNVTSTAAELNILDGKAFLDEDNMASNSATGIASQQSIKAYVDTQITAEDLDITTDSGTIAIDLDSETLTVSGGTGLSSSATGNAVTLAIDSTVATLTGSQTLTNKSLTAPTLTGTATVASLDISGDIDVDGTTNLDVVDIDGAVDMASTLAVAGVLTGASLDISGDIDIDGTANLDVVDIDGAVDMATTLAVAGNVDFNGDLDVDGTTNLDVVDIDGAVNMATTALVTGVLTTTAATVHTNGITMPDSAKAIFGAGSDLQIYHDGSNSYITDAGTGSLILRGTAGVYIQDAAGNENLLGAAVDGAVTLYHNDAAKLATASGGVTVTGEVAATSLDISGDIDVDGTTNLDAVDVDGAVNFAADVTFADGADIITASAGTSNFRAGVNAGNSIASGGNYNTVNGRYNAGTAQ